MDFSDFIEESQTRILSVLRKSLLRHDFESASVIYQTVQEGTKLFAISALDIYNKLDIESLKKQASSSLILQATATMKHIFAFLFFFLAGIYTTILCPVIFFIPRILCSRPTLNKSQTDSGHKPRFSIVILSYKRIRTLERTLKCLIRSTHNDNREIIIVDNGSGPKVTQRLEMFKDQSLIDKLILNKENMGISEGYNMGFSAADPASKYLVKLDQDIQVLGSGWLDRILEILRASPRIGLVALDQSNHPGLLISPKLKLNASAYKVKSWANWVCGSCMIIPQQIFTEIGYFREKTGLRYFPDDVDYYNRVVRAGYETYYLCGTACYHVPKLSQYAILAILRLDPDVKKWQRVMKNLLDRYDSGLDSISLYYDHYRQPRMK